MTDDKIAVRVDTEVAIPAEFGENCPKCGSALQTGYGLAGGGMGVYGYCDPCGRVVWKCLTEG